MPIRQKDAPYTGRARGWLCCHNIWRRIVRCPLEHGIIREALHIGIARMPVLLRPVESIVLDSHLVEIDEARDASASTHELERLDKDCVPRRPIFTRGIDPLDEF